MYLDYVTYKQIGGELDETAFNSLIVKAESRINTVTFGRLKSMQIIPETVKYCLRDILKMYDAIKKLSTTNDENIASYSNDGVNVAYNNLQTAVNTQNEYMKQITATIRDYLLDEVDDEGTPLLYCGVG